MSFYNIPRRSAILGMALALAVPALGAAQSDPKMGGTLKVSHSTRIATLNVLSLSGPAEYPVIDMAYSGLTRIGPDSQPMPDLAESWEGSADATEFTFNLREGVTFHDGSPATASDVVATYEAILDPDIPASAASVLNMIDSVEAIDDLTVKFSLNAPFADFPTSTAHANARIMSEEALAGDHLKLNTVVNGTGPFKMESYDSARITRLVRNDDYFIEGKPYLDAVEMHLFPDLAAETTNFLSGDIDVMLLVQQADYERIASSPGINALRVPSGRYVNVVMRFDQEPFNDLKVREALAYAIDRQLLVDLVLEGLGRAAHDNILSPEFKYRIDTPEKTYDPILKRRRRYWPRPAIPMASSLISSPRTGPRSARRWQLRSSRWHFRRASTSTSRPCRTTPTSPTSGGRASSTWPTGECSRPRTRHSTCC